MRGAQTSGEQGAFPEPVADGHAVDLPVYAPTSRATVVALWLLFGGIPLALALYDPELWPYMSPFVVGVAIATLLGYQRRRGKIRYVTAEPEGLRLASPRMRASGSSELVPWSDIVLLQFAQWVPRAIGEPPLLEGIEVATAERRWYFVTTPELDDRNAYRELLRERAAGAFGVDHGTGEVLSPRHRDSMRNARLACSLAERTVQRFYWGAKWSLVGVASLPLLLALLVQILVRPANPQDAVVPVLLTTAALLGLAALATYAGHRRAARLREAWHGVGGGAARAGRPANEAVVSEARRAGDAPRDRGTREP